MILVPRRSKSFGMIAAMVLVAVIAPASRAEDELGAGKLNEGEIIFVRSVLPLLKTKCFACHGADESDLRGELNLMSRDAALKGGESGETSLVPGDAQASPIYLSARRDSDWSAMPPKENDAVEASQLAALGRWIDLGAPWPDESRSEAIRNQYHEQWDAEGGVRVTTSGGLDSDWTNRRYEPADLWAYQPLGKHIPPGAPETPSAAIDAFIDARLANIGLAPAPPADRRTLIRRATYDLIGLPPTIEDVEAFVGDPESDAIAFGRVVDRLLASPHYGERWGQHWLDVTRYADSSGFANDYERGNAWRYRDYVVRAFNQDKPYDDFVREQIAGDEIDANDPEKLIAVGFLRMGPWELTGMEVAKVARQRFLDDATDAIGQVFLGQMLQCCRCHDHKFDPIPTRDYYSIQSCLATTQLAERDAAFLPDENTSGFDSETQWLSKRRGFYGRQLDRLNEQQVAAARQWFREKRLDDQAFEVALKESGGDFGAARNRLLKSSDSDETVPPRHVGFESADFGVERVVRKGVARLKWQVDRYEPIAFSVYNGYTPEQKNVDAPQRIPEDRMRGELESTAILAGGDPFSPSTPVDPGVISAVQTVSHWNLESPPPVEGRRLALARWITSPANPLTPRVIVNRIWLGHMGRAIAGNPNNFGATGKKPTHPELMDWLASEFLRSGQSIKAAHRMIMLSNTYRRSSIHRDPDAVASADPNGESYAVFTPRRLTAEELRDSMLAVSGEMNPAIGGIPVRPEINLEAALQPRMVMGTFAEAWQPSANPRDRHRRTIYTLKLRGLRDPFLEVFNAPSPDLSLEQRETSTVTPQVFALFNAQSTYYRAIAMASRVAGANDDPSREMINAVFRRALGRDATADECDTCLEHWIAMKRRHQSMTLHPATYPREVVREAVEENTGEKFVFTEPLEVADEYVADLGPSDVSPSVRGLAEVCLVLLNSNEFAYVD